MTVGMKTLFIKTNFPIINPMPTEMRMEFTEIIMKALLSAITLSRIWFEEEFLNIVSTPLK